MANLSFYAAVCSDVGRVRKNNEDNFSLLGSVLPEEACYGRYLSRSDVVQEGVVAVFDGMGGINNGEVASMQAAQLVAMYRDSLLSLSPASMEDYAAAANAAIVSEAQPTLIFVSPLHVDHGTPLEEDVEAGRFTECTLRDYITEEIEFVRRLNVQDCIFFGLHISNPVRVSGMLPKDRDLIIRELELGMGRFPEWRLDSVPSKGAEGRMVR